MTEAKCKNCKHWYVSSVCPTPDIHNECRRIEHVFSYKYNEGIKDPSMKDKVVLVTCGEDWQGIEANPYTGPDFGCIHFERREEHDLDTP